MLDAAAYEFGTAGYQAASIAAIADRVGVSKALVLTYFGSKEGLYVACVERASVPLIDAIEAVIRTPQAPAAMAEATLAAIFRSLESRPHDWNVINDRSLPAGGRGATAATRVRRTIAGQARRGIEVVAESPAGGDRDDLALLTDVWMSAVSAVVNWWLRHPNRSAEEMATRSRRLVALVTGAPGAS